LRACPLRVKSDRAWGRTGGRPLVTPSRQILSSSDCGSKGLYCLRHNTWPVGVMALIIDNSNSVADGGVSLDGTATTITVAAEGYIYDISGVPIFALELANAAYT